MSLRELVFIMALLASFGYAVNVFLHIVNPEFFYMPITDDYRLLTALDHVRGISGIVVLSLFSEKIRNAFKKSKS